MPEFCDCRGGGTWAVAPTTCNDAVSVMVNFTLERMVSDNVITFVIK